MVGWPNDRKNGCGGGKNLYLEKYLLVNPWNVMAVLVSIHQSTYAGMHQIFIFIFKF